MTALILTPASALKPNKGSLLYQEADLFVTHFSGMSLDKPLYTPLGLKYAIKAVVFMFIIIVASIIIIIHHHCLHHKFTTTMYTLSVIGTFAEEKVVNEMQV